ncbi:unnamed protein product [Parajaminaea phylloscopi]
MPGSLAQSHHKSSLPRHRSGTTQSSSLSPKQLRVSSQAAPARSTGAEQHSQLSSSTPPPASTSVPETSPSRSSPSPPPPPDPPKTWTARIKDLYAQLKFLFKFYFNGVKQIWRDRQVVQEIHTRCAAEQREMTWGEARIVRMHKKDIRKLPLFLAILIIVEEILPLVVIYAPFLLPSTCILPSQLLKIRHGEEVKRAAAVERLRTSEALRQLLAASSLPGFNKGATLGSPSSKTEQSVYNLPTLTADAQSRLDQLWKELDTATLTDLNAVFALPTTLRPASMLRRNLEKHAAYLAADDALLRSGQEKGQDDTTAPPAAVSDLHAANERTTSVANFPEDLPSLAEAASQRGLRASEASEDDVSRSLSSWARMTGTLGSRRALVDSAVMHDPQSTAPASQTQGAQEQAPHFSFLDIILLPLSLYPPPNLFTPSLVAPKEAGAPKLTGAAAVQATLSRPTEIEAAQANLKEGSLLDKSKAVVREVVEAEEKKEQEQEQRRRRQEEQNQRR